MDFLDLMHARFSIVEIIRTIVCQSVAVEAMDTVVSLTPRCKYFEDLMLGALWVAGKGSTVSVAEEKVRHRVLLVDNEIIIFLMRVPNPGVLQLGSKPSPSLWFVSLSHTLSFPRATSLDKKIAEVAQSSDK